MKRPGYSKNILDLPNDMLSVILSKVGENSHQDLIACIFSCRTFRDVSKYRNVLEKLRLDETFPLPLKKIPENPRIIYQCAEAGNKHAIFLCGLIDYFFLKKTFSGSANLKVAADAKHPEAMYLYGMMMIGENQLTEGSLCIMNLWKERGFQVVRQCSENCHSVVLEMSVRQLREYEIWLAIMEVGEGCVVEDLDEVCEKCLIYKEISRFIDYMNV